MLGRRFQFGAFEVDQGLGELRKHGIKIRVQEQPFQILVLLLERPNEIVGREEIRARLWPENTFVDFDNAISSAVRKLREALSDSADNPRFIETLARRGYRFIGQIAVQSAAPPVPRPTRIKAVAIGAGALLILGASTWWLRPHAQSKATEPTPVPLTAAPGWEMQPSFSPDGTQIAYAWDETGTKNNTSINPIGTVDNAHIFVKLIGSGTPVQVTSGANADSYPAWSPDGRSLAFVRSLNQGDALFLIPPLGGSERKVADGYFVNGSSWSPDGKFLAVADRKSPNDPPSLYLISTEDGERLRLTTPPNVKTEDRDPAFSPDRRTLLFIRCHERYACGLYLLDLSPGYRPRASPRPLKEENSRIDRAAWTSHGKEVVYAAFSESATFRLSRISLGPAAAPQRLAYPGARVFNPAIALPADRLAYAQSLSNEDILQIQPGTPPRGFASSTRFEGLPQYSTDGRRVAFCSDRSGQMEIWVCAADGSHPVQLTNFQDWSGTPRWSPDGTSLAFDRHLKGVWHVLVMASDGGASRRLTSNDSDEVVPSWSRDGKWIYYASNRTGRYEIWKAPAKGGQGTQVTRNGGWTAFESYDGQSLYYTKNLDSLDHQSGLWTLSVRGGPERLVLESVCCRAFSVMEDGIYYSPVPGPGEGSSLRFYDFATRENREVAAIDEYVRNGLAVSPDRKTFLFGAATQVGSNIMIVDNFR
jgi:Tol biopolymer transport system component/DNA-binding winged helix-turn-helix (wHTH) protein